MVLDITIVSSHVFSSGKMSEEYQDEIRLEERNGEV
jgi:hypothetical protein